MESATQQSAIVLVMDRIGAGWLGPYGNTWIDTPNWNRLAAESTLWEFVIADSPNLLQTYQGFWGGRHGLRPAANATLLQRARRLGVQTALICDEPQLAASAEPEWFEERSMLPPATAAVAALSVEHMHLTQVLATAVEWLSAVGDQPFLLWIHAQALQGLWDAPYDFRLRLADEEDPEPPDFVTAPRLRLEDDFDPDLLLGYTHAYGGQITAIDTALGGFLDAVAQIPRARESLLCFSAPRGCALGEHGFVGAHDELLFGEILQTPLLVRQPNGAGAAQRRQAQRQSHDIASVIGRWLDPQDEEADGADAADRPLLFAGVGERRAIRAPAWFLTQPCGEAPHLYVKPDDRWEFNEVSNRCQDVVEQLQALIDAFDESLRADQEFEPGEIPALVLEGLE